MSEVPRNLDVSAAIETSMFNIINEEVEVLFDNKSGRVGVVEVWSEEIGDNRANQTEDEAEQSEGAVPQEYSLSNAHDGTFVTLAGVQPEAIASLEKSGILVDHDHDRQGCDGSCMIERNVAVWHQLWGFQQMLSCQMLNEKLLIRALKVMWSFFRWISEVKQDNIQGDKDQAISSINTGQRDARPVAQEWDNELSVCPTAGFEYRSDKEEDSPIARSVGLAVSPNQGKPTPIEGHSPAAINLQVVLSPNLQTKQSSRRPQVRGKKHKRNISKISAEARECFRYGQRLRIHSPYPRKSLANIDRILKNSGTKKHLQ